MNNKINFEKIRDTIFNVYSKIKLLLLSTNNLTLQNSNSEKIIEDIYNLLNILNTNMTIIKNNDILLQGILDRYYGELKEIKIFLVRISSIKSRSFHNKIFIKILKTKKYMPLGITIVFEEFVKGITFFETEMENKKKIPIYHRMASCGDSSDNYKKKYLQCYNNNIPEDLEIKRNHIFKCYIERLIYDNMYKELTLHFPITLNDKAIKQNEGHRHQITERAINFNKCFLEIDVKINILYDNNFPVYLVINYYKDNNEIKKESYLKSTYIDDYGNTRYLENIYYTLNENNKETTKVITFTNIN